MSTEISQCKFFRIQHIFFLISKYSKYALDFKIKIFQFHEKLLEFNTRSCLFIKLLFPVSNLPHHACTMYNVHCAYYQTSKEGGGLYLVNMAIYGTPFIARFMSITFLLLLMMESNLLPSNEFPSVSLQRAHCADMVSPMKLNHMSSNGILDVYHALYKAR